MQVSSWKLGLLACVAYVPMMHGVQNPFLPVEEVKAEIYPPETREYIEAARAMGWKFKQETFEEKIDRFVDQYYDTMWPGDAFGLTNMSLQNIFDGARGSKSDTTAAQVASHISQVLRGRPKHSAVIDDIGWFSGE